MGAIDKKREPCLKYPGDNIGKQKQIDKIKRKKEEQKVGK